MTQINTTSRERKCCPVCESLRIIKRKSTSNYVCYACGHEGHYVTKMAKDCFNRPLEALA